MEAMKKTALLQQVDNAKREGREEERAKYEQERKDTEQFQRDQIINFHRRDNEAAKAKSYESIQNVLSHFGINIGRQG